jgi:hypothetical protein
MPASFETVVGSQVLVATVAATTLPFHSHKNASAGLRRLPYSSYVGPCKQIFKPSSLRETALSSHLSKGCTPSRLEASIFLTSTVPPNALRFLRFLEVVFPPFDENYLHLDELAYQDWLRTIDYVSDKLCLPTLTLRV